MGKLDFNQFLLLNEKNFDHFQNAFNYLKDYAEWFKESHFEIDNILELRGLVDKFIQFGEPIRDTYNPIYIELLSLVKDLETEAYRHVSSIQDSEIPKAYQNFYSKFIEVYNKISLYFRNSKNDYLSFNGLFSYEISSKEQAIKLIKEVLDLIQNENSITDKSKKKIINYLNEIIDELTNPTTNWKKFFSRISEAIVVIAALSTIIGETANTQLFEASNKLKQAQDSIVYSSINLNQNNLRQTFIIENYKIENNRIALPEKSESNKNKETETTPD